MIWDRKKRSSFRLTSKRDNKKGRPRRSTSSKSRRDYSDSGSSLPPVMVRGMATGALVGNSKTYNRSRRRIDFPLSVPGAEVRLPSIPQIKIGWRLFSLLLVFLSGFLIYEFWNSEEYLMDIAEVVGLKYITSREVNSFLAVQGKPVFMLNPISIKQDLLDTYPEFSDVSVKVEFPNKLKIDVVERAPVLVWNYNGLNMLIAEDGSAYPQRDENLDINQFPFIRSDTDPSDVSGIARDITVPTGINPNQLEFSPGTLNSGLEKSEILLPADLVSAIQFLSDYVPDRAELIYDEVHGLMWEDERGWDVYFGYPESIELKILVYKALFNHLKGEGLQPEIISIESPHNPYYRLEE